MSKHNLQIEEETFKIGLKAKFLTYNLITLSRWLKPSVDNGQHTTDNSFRVWRNLSKKSYSEYNLQKSYLIQGVSSCLAISYCNNLNSNNI